MNILKNSIFQRILLIGIIVILLLLWKNSIETKNLENRLLKQNIEAIKDSSEYYIDSLDGLLTSERLAFLGDLENLKIYNTSLYNKIKKLESNPKVIVLSGSETEMEIHGFSGDTTNTTLNQISENEYDLSWKFEDIGNGWAKILEGKTEFKINQLNNSLDIIAGNTYIKTDSLNFVVDTYFIMNPDSSYSAIAKSSYPGMILKTSGVLYPEKIVEYVPILEKKNKITWGIQSGFGFNPISLSGGGSPIVIYVGVGINYELGKIIEW